MEIFIGSSTEQKPLAEFLVDYILENFNGELKPVPWYEPWPGGEFTLETLLEIAERTDASIVVLHPDDVVLSRGEELSAPRDNLVFEAGLFMGAQGRARTRLLMPSDPTTRRFKTPTDIAGLTVHTYRWRDGDSFESSGLPVKTRNLCQQLAALGPRTRPLTPSPNTPSSEITDALVNGTLEAMCRAASLPRDPAQARVRAFIFKLEGEELVCRYYWAQNPTSEKVGVTRFPMNGAAAKEVAVVRAAAARKITRSPVGRLSPGLEEAASESVEGDLTFVLAAPILDRRGKVWGTVDFDTSNDIGKERLSTDLADAAIYQLTKHLQVVFSLLDDAPAGQ